MSPYFANDMFDIVKHQREFSFSLDIFQIEATGHFFFKYSLNSSYFYIFYKICRMSRACILDIDIYR